MGADGELATRMCIVTRECLDEAALLRFVRSPEGVVVPDLARKLPGRGVWVRLNRGLVAEASRKRVFSRSFSAETRSPDDLPDLVGRLLRQTVLSMLPLARKAGEAVTGFMKVEDALQRGRTRILIHAADAQPDGCRKLDRLADETVERVTMFSGEELDLAFGRSNVVHAAVTRGGLAEKLVAAVRRIDLYEAPLGPKGSEESV